MIPHLLVLFTQQLDWNLSDNPAYPFSFAFGMYDNEFKANKMQVNQG